MLKQSTPILERTRRAYLAYYKGMRSIKTRYPFLDASKEVSETRSMIILLTEELKKRKEDE